MPLRLYDKPGGVDLEDIKRNVKSLCFEVDSKMGEDNMWLGFAS